jgi:hypothetical protein
VGQRLQPLLEYGRVDEVGSPASLEGLNGLVVLILVGGVELVQVGVEAHPGAREHLGGCDGLSEANAVDAHRLFVETSFDCVESRVVSDVDGQAQRVSVNAGLGQVHLVGVGHVLVRLMRETREILVGEVRLCGGGNLARLDSPRIGGCFGGENPSREGADTG